MSEQTDETRTFILNKLVRDRIPEINQAEGIQVDYELVQGELKIFMLIKKLIEEAKECKVNLTAEELTDVYDVLGALVLEAGFTMSDISAIHTEKTEKLGDFTGGHFIKTLTVPNDSEWAHYYGADPHRFPEIIEGL